MQVLAHPAGIAALAAGLLVIVVSILLINTAERDKKQADRIADVESVLREMLSEGRSDGDAQARRSREELNVNLRGMGDSVTRLMNEMARTQQSQLDAFTGQLRDMRHADDRHMEELRQSVDARLMAYEGRMDRIGDVLDDKLEMNDRRAEKLQETFRQQMTALRVNNDRRLIEIRESVDEQLSSSLDRRLGESFAQVSARLDQVYQGLGEMQSLASGVGELKKVLTNVRARGLVGEIQLSALLGQIMSPDQFNARVIIESGGDPADYAIRLPGRDGERESLLPIDAGFSQEHYDRLLDALDAGDQALIDEQCARLEDALVARAEYLSKQFLDPPRTTAFAVMFLPVEGLYAEALRKPGLPERLQREYGVTLAGPATLTALLNSLQMGFKSILLEKRSVEVWSLLNDVRGEFTQFAGALSRTQKRLRQASESIEDATRKSRTIEKRLKGVKRLGDREDNHPALEDDEEYGNADWD